MNNDSGLRKDDVFPPGKIKHSNGFLIIAINYHREGFTAGSPFFLFLWMICWTRCFFVCSEIWNKGLAQGNYALRGLPQVTLSGFIAEFSPVITAFISSECMLKSKHSQRN